MWQYLFGTLTTGPQISEVKIFFNFLCTLGDASMHAYCSAPPVTGFKIRAIPQYLGKDLFMVTSALLTSLGPYCKFPLCNHDFFKNFPIELDGIDCKF